MTFLSNCPEFWGPWNHASLTSISKRHAEIKVGVREGFSIKGIFSLKKSYSLNPVKRKQTYKDPGTAGVLIGNLLGWLWLKSKIYPKYLKFLDIYKISHPRPIGPSFSDFSWEEMDIMGLWTLNQGDVVVNHKTTSIQFKWKVENNKVYGIAKKIRGKGKIQLETIGVKCKTFPKPTQTLKDNYYNIKIFEDIVHFTTDFDATKATIRKIVMTDEAIPKSSANIRDSIEALLTLISVNSLKTPDHGWLTSLTRRGSVAYNGWVNFLWDNSFIGMMSAIHYPQLAVGNIESMCSELSIKGFLPNQSNTVARSETISQLPVTSYCSLKVNKLLGADMSKVIPPLEKNNNWWLLNRDPNGFHLLSYGSELKKRCTAASRQMAMYEAGMDNHPMFDKVPMDYESGCMAMYSVCLNSIYALDCLSLSELAKIHQNEKLANKLEIRYNNMKKIINKFLWDGETYRNRYWNGEFQEDLFPNFLLPLIAGIPTQQQAESTVKKIFRKCLTSYGIAPSTIDHYSFKDQITWRGRLLPPMQFLVSEALRRYEFDLEASDLARRCYRCFHQEWENESHFHESYNGYTGDGDDVNITGEPNHPWAGLFAYLAIQDFIDYEVWNGLRLGRLEHMNGGIYDIPIQNDKYSVNISNKEMTIIKNGKLITKSSYPLIFRSFNYETDSVSFKYKALKPIKLEIPLKSGNYNIQLGEERYSEQVNEKNLLELNLKKLTDEIFIKTAK